MIYQSQKEVLNALAMASKGDERRNILYQGDNRYLVLNTGAGFMMYSGELTKGQTVKEKLSNINVAVLKRLNAKTGTPDGLGTFGGLAERTNPYEFYKMSTFEKMALIGQKDDVILLDNVPTLTKDMDIICYNNIIRESKEELADLGIHGLDFSKANFVPVDLRGVKDDNYIINIWDGQGIAFAVNPQCHMLKTSDEFISLIEKQSKTNVHKKESEASAVDKTPLFNVLSAYGKKGGRHLAEDGRDLERDYRYPHEWLVTWAIAAKTLKHNAVDMIKLAQEVQAASNHLIDFDAASKRMSVDIGLFSNAMGVSKQTIRQMQNKMHKTYNKKQQNINIINKNNRENY